MFINTWFERLWVDHCGGLAMDGGACSIQICIYWWLDTGRRQLQCVGNGVIAVFHWDVELWIYQRVHIYIYAYAYFLYVYVYAMVYEGFYVYDIGGLNIYCMWVIFSSLFSFYILMETYWGRVKHISVSKLDLHLILDSGLALIRYQVIVWPNVGSLSIEP